MKDLAKAFWDWFLSHQADLEEFITSDDRDYKLYKELTQELKKFNSLLFPEITIDPDKDFVLIITPDGIKEGMTATQDIVSQAPEIKGWKIKKYRQAVDHINLNYNGLAYEYKDVKIWRQFVLEKDKVDIAVIIRGYQEEDKRYRSLAFLYLDHILGEFNVLTRVRHIDFYSWEEVKKDIDTIDLLSLRKEIEHNLY